MKRGLSFLAMQCHVHRDFDLCSCNNMVLESAFLPRIFVVLNLRDREAMSGKEWYVHLHNHGSHRRDAEKFLQHLLHAKFLY